MLSTARVVRVWRNDRFINLSASLLPMAGSLIALPILSRQLTVAEYGLWALLLTTITTLQLLDFGISASIMRYASVEAAAGNPKGAWPYWWSSSIIFAFVACGVGVLGWVLGAVEFIARRTESDPEAVFGLFVLCVLLAPICNTQVVLQRALGGYRLVLGGAVVGQVAFLGTVLTLSASGELSLAKAVVAQSCQLGLTLVFLLLASWRSLKPVLLDRQRTATLFSFGMRMLTVNATNAVMMYSPLWATAWLLAPESAGLYAFSSTLAIAARNLPLMTVAPLVNRLAAAESVFTAGQGEQRRWRRQIVPYIAIIALGGLTAAGTLGGKSYEDAGPVVATLVLGYGAGVLTAVLSQTLRLANREGLEVQSWLLGGLAQILVLVPLILVLGAWGAAVAVVIGQSVACVSMHRYMKAAMAQARVEDVKV